MIQIGTYDELLETSSIFVKLLEDINQHEEEEQKLEGSFSDQQSINSENDDLEEDNNLLPKTLETKQQGTVNWHVYTSYLHSGIGVILGCLVIMIIFGSQQIISIYSNWWLLAWSDDENRRHHNSTNCMSIENNKTDKIYLMNDTEWNRHRNQRFYGFSGHLNE